MKNDPPQGQVVNFVRGHRLPSLYRIFSLSNFALYVQLCSSNILAEGFIILKHLAVSGSEHKGQILSM